MRLSDTLIRRSAGRANLVPTAQILFAFLFAVTTQAASTSPEDMVKRIYAEIMKDKFMGGADDPSSTSQAPESLSREWFSEKFFAARKNDEKCKEGEDEGVGILWNGGQDVEIKKKPKVTVVKPGEDRQVVRAKFKNFDLDEMVDYTFVKTPDGWRIDDIRRDGKDLYKAMAKEHCKK